MCTPAGVGVSTFLLMLSQAAMAEQTERTEKLLERAIHSQHMLSGSAVTLFSLTGQAATFKVDFQRTQDNSVDLYFLMGLSGSAQGHLSNVQTLGSDLLKALNEISRSGRIGEAHSHCRLLAQLFPIPWAIPAPTHQRQRSDGP